MCSLTGCDILSKDGGTLPADEAKVEIRSAGQEIMTNMSQMMVTPQLQSMEFFMLLMDVDMDLKSQEKSKMHPRHHLYLNRIGKHYLAEHIEALVHQKDDLFETGIFQYNFNTGEFDMVNANVNYIQFIYPSDQNAYNARQNNAQLTIRNLVLEESYVDYGDEFELEVLLRSVDMDMEIDNEVVMEFSYAASYNDQGLPTSVQTSLNMPPYQMTASFTGSGSNYNYTMSFKENNSTIMSADLDIRYNASRDDAEKVSGKFQLTPLRFSGEMHPIDMDNCGYEDLTCVNDGMDVRVYQTELKKYIGDLESRWYYDEYYDEQYMEPAIVYEDGSYEFLVEIFGNMFEKR